MHTLVRVWFWVVGALVVGSLIASPIIAYTTQRVVVAEVTRSERVCSGGEQVNCRYLVFTDETTFENTDTLWFLKFNSSDVYGRLHNGQTYRFTVTGFRVPLLSWYPNIVTVEPGAA